MSQENGPGPLAQGDTGPENVTAAAKPPLRLAAHSTAGYDNLSPAALAWARALIEGADGPVPEYGCLAWAALPDDSRTKVAACVAAAERWRTRHHRSDLYAPVDSAWARRIAEARRPRPGDHPGGPVPWEREVAADA